MAGKSPEELDRLLDEALASYAGEPRPGLEERVLAHVHANGRSHRRSWWRWVAAVPVLACLVLACSVLVPWIARRHTPAVPIRAAVAPPTVVATPPPALHRAVRRRPLPRRDRFPVPAPLTDQERALLDLVARFPEHARVALAATDEVAIKPIEIERIQIPLIESGNESK